MQKIIIKVNILILPLLILVSCTTSNRIKVLRLDKSNIHIEVGETEKLNLSTEPAMESIPEIIWTVSNEKVAEVDNGFVKAISVGECVITAKTKEGKLSATSNVNVKPKSIKELKLDKNSVNLEVGNSEKLNLTLVPIDAATTEIEWISSDDKIVTVDNDGVIKAMGTGAAIVTAQTKDGVISTVSNVTVNEKSVKGINLNKKSLKLQVGETEKLQVTFEPTDAGNQEVTYGSNNTKVATVDSSGTVKAIAQGTANITAKSYDGGFTSICTITVNPKPAASKSSESKPDVPKPANSNELKFGPVPPRAPMPVPTLIPGSY